MRNNMRKNNRGERAEGEVMGEIKVERNNDMTKKKLNGCKVTEKMKEED
jgi:hypothetical protein